MLREPDAGTVVGLATEVDWGNMTRGVFSALCYAAVFGALALWRFARKDITS